MEFPYKPIKSVKEYIDCITEDTKNWKYDNLYGHPWFRGQPNVKPPLPSVYRTENVLFDEFNLTRTFRERASTIGNVPDRREVDQWLFLMQHHGLPTRLLDWTESPLIALFFAVNYINDSERDSGRAIWMLHPLELNYYSIHKRVLPNTWAMNNSGCINFHAAFGVNCHKIEIEENGKKREYNIEESTLPVAVPAFYCHPRMFSQKSCFTIHGKNKKDFESIYMKHEIVTKGYFIKYVIPNNKSEDIKKELNIMGITYSTIFPDLEGLARELRERFNFTPVITFL